NDMARGHWLKLRLRSRNAAGVANGFGDTSTATVWLDGVPLRRTVGGVSYLSQGSHTLHWGLGTATRVARLTVRWHAGGTREYRDLDADAFYEIAEDDPVPRKVAWGGAATTGLDPARGPGVVPADDRERQLAFWKSQREAMDAMKVHGDNAEAIRLFRDAIALNPAHEDSRYYLGLCLASRGETDAALEALAALQRLNPQSHRAWQQWGVVRALFARGDADLAAAEGALERARALNPEETGALLVLGEVALLRGDPTTAERRLAAATGTNPRAVGGFFLRGYLAWKRGDAAAARAMLEQTRKALGPDWQPKGSTGEGDVKRRQHVEKTPLAAYWEGWDGTVEPGLAYARLDARLAR
ncbi:MAG: tetratricopeptide repeat protein, partial [Verrucomicrobia bacterium]